MTRLNENWRTYIYPDGATLTLENVRNLEVSKSNGHRLTLGNGMLVYVAPKWLAIAINSDLDWEM